MNSEKRAVLVLAVVMATAIGVCDCISNLVSTQPEELCWDLSRLQGLANSVKNLQISSCDQYSEALRRLSVAVGKPCSARLHGRFGLQAHEGNAMQYFSTAAGDETSSI